MIQVPKRMSNLYIPHTQIVDFMVYTNLFLLKMARVSSWVVSTENQL